MYYLAPNQPRPNELIRPITLLGGKGGVSRFPSKWALNYCSEMKYLLSWPTLGHSLSLAGDIDVVYRKLLIWGRRRTPFFFNLLGFFPWLPSTLSRRKEGDVVYVLFLLMPLGAV